MNGEVVWSDAFGHVRLAAPAVTPPWQVDEVDLTDYPDFMAKEIAEQPVVAERLLEELLPSLWGRRAWGSIDLGAVERVRLIGCGTSLNAAAVTARMLRSVAGVPVEAVVASEQDDWLPVPGTLNVAFSQSGETADVLTALEQVAGPVLAVTNSPYSSLALRADAVVSCLAGPEIGVAASKTFTAQVLSGAVLALAVARARGALDNAGLRSMHELLIGVPDRLAAALAVEAMADVVAEFVEQSSGFLFVSRGAGVPYAAEGALKLKELTYHWAESLAAGELKHGPIALIGQGTPVVVVESEPAAKLASNIAEMQARGAQIIRVGRSAEALLPAPTVPAPWGPLESVVALQHLARSLARRLGLDVDKPRNLAKCVTVE
jgi:glutamine---fructose-6-phosphate transaminase (isomerizing)